MKSNVKQKWINALTSGEYKQVCGVMRGTKSVPDDTFDTYGDPYMYDVADMSPKNNSMCVMGVLADLALRDSGLKTTEENWLKFANDNEWPSPRTLKWAGLDGEKVAKVIGFNDKKTKTFKELARYIDKNL